MCMSMFFLKYLKNIDDNTSIQGPRYMKPETASKFSGKPSVKSKYYIDPIYCSDIEYAKFVNFESELVVWGIILEA